jgi:hypothetical protein
MRSSPPKKVRNPTPGHPESPMGASNPKRRGFLLALGAGGIGAAAIAARSLPGAAPVTASGGSDAAVGEGYRVTDHVKRYYQTTKT